MKVVINGCYGGFSLSRKALHQLRELGNEHALADVDWGEKYSDGSVNSYHYNGFLRSIPRDDPQLVQVVEEMGADANGSCADLVVIEIPDGISWHVEEYDGNEHIAEDHRTWR